MGYLQSWILTYEKEFYIGLTQKNSIENSVWNHLPYIPQTDGPCYNSETLVLVWEKNLIQGLHKRTRWRTLYRIYPYLYTYCLGPCYDYTCYELKFLELSNRTTLVLSNTRELNRVPSAKQSTLLYDVTLFQNLLLHSPMPRDQSCDFAINL